ncbi:N(2)-fixation sustaining protein CowN [Rhodospirillum rubrum]|uniref:N(2)-fixation sustaining protein CowN n=1 Tax=Rhodospirillum rubrum (strain ATCC 11170 / ATH 1.1.1 / DSM 467 / LMG 4362 / NCIMB 8255 / S1) TaxID=269796 RepID=COWN_RHORT|nr:N(2)-fixation sustaining protein CowN [Rhodospirillum rubrum]Q2RNI5.1 RecName: Full=N(2)-fixation sustaining protein CowN; AltName: Full=CO weal-nitrogenase [Rhodospirillum rubrum ATCC 11170]ABC24310.1 conserved hypothetical protein [Rhodospirillum rubrum ATCC 11170]MBK1663071.1 N(2)-fixation sustaining protein CowN [Rhodospirillum rubrum]MBK1675774.1 N(2)-fixation sustaining protein CowN [Rhodospirillum rubrum]MBK5956029.1 N(2)-fixation sustaining protein CowN [Rhodospirillum rubrum]QXG80
MTMDGPAHMPRRYVTFQGVNVEGLSQQLIARILFHVADPAKSNAFWEHFKAKLADADKTLARTADSLCLLCGAIGYIDELFEDNDDEEGLTILRRLEDELC